MQGWPTISTSILLNYKDTGMYTEMRVDLAISAKLDGNDFIWKGVKAEQVTGFQ